MPGSGPARLGPLRSGNCLALLPLQLPGIAAMNCCAGRQGALQHNSGVRAHIGQRACTLTL